MALRAGNRDAPDSGHSDDGGEDGTAAITAAQATALRSGVAWLWAALLLAALMMVEPFLHLRSPFIMLGIYVATLVCGAIGIVTANRALQGRSSIIGILFLFLPLFNVVALMMSLTPARAALRRNQLNEEADRLLAAEQERLKRREASRKLDAASAPQTAARTAAKPAPPKPNDRIARAVAYVKHAGLGDLPEGQILNIRTTAGGPEIPEQDLPVVRTAKGAFALFYAVDEGAHFSFISRGELQAAGITGDALHAIGLANLTAIANGGAPGLSLTPAGTVHGLVMGGNYEASLMVVDALWDGMLKPYTPNGAVAVVPSRDVCAFCDAGSADGIAHLRNIVANVSQGGDRLLSDKLYIRTNQRWLEYTGGGKPELAPLEFSL
ncbi:MAG: hypothetical protein HYX47_16875 [Burkholderiales bacterium]|nr:hypothetical protein [Burkholderiales bacterium]